jgi:hypothetical protein
MFAVETGEWDWIERGRFFAPFLFMASPARHQGHQINQGSAQLMGGSRRIDPRDLDITPEIGCTNRLLSNRNACPTKERQCRDS